MRRTIIIGDVHGCFDEMIDLVEKCQYNAKTDQLIFVGDVVNKGPRSAQVLRWIREGRHQAVLGNHELRLIDIIDGHAPADSSIKQTLVDLKNNFKGQLAEIIDWIRSWPTYIEEEDFIIVHAGVHPHKDLASTEKQILTNIRTWDGIGENLNHPFHPSWHSLYLGQKLIIYGHWATQGLHITENTIGLDSGCVYGGHLSAAIFPDKRIVQVSARRAYQTV